MEVVSPPPTLWLALSPYWKSTHAVRPQPTDNQGSGLYSQQECITGSSMSLQAGVLQKFHRHARVPVNSKLERKIPQMCLCRVNKDSSPDPASSGPHRWLLCSQRSPGPWTGSPLQWGCRKPLSLCLKILLQTSDGSSLDRSINCCCISGITQKLGKAISWWKFFSNASAVFVLSGSTCSSRCGDRNAWQCKHWFFRACSSFIPTKHRFNRPPECRKDKSNSNTMKIFSLLRHKAESLAGNGGGGGPAGEDLSTAEEINCRLLVVVHYRSSGELQKEFGVGLGSVAGEGFTHSKPLSLWLLLCAAITHSMHTSSCTES